MERVVQYDTVRLNIIRGHLWQQALAAGVAFGELGGLQGWSYFREGGWLEGMLEDVTEGYVLLCRTCPRVGVFCLQSSAEQ